MRNVPSGVVAMLLLCQCSGGDSQQEENQVFSSSCNELKTGEQRCAAGVMQRCDGSQWVAAEDCAANGMECVAQGTQAACDTGVAEGTVCSTTEHCGTLLECYEGYCIRPCLSNGECDSHQVCLEGVDREKYCFDRPGHHQPCYPDYPAYACLESRDECVHLMIVGGYVYGSCTQYCPPENAYTQEGCGANEWCLPTRMGSLVPEQYCTRPTESGDCNTQQPQMCANPGGGAQPQCFAKITACLPIANPWGGTFMSSGLPEVDERCGVTSLDSTTFVTPMCGPKNPVGTPAIPDCVEIAEGVGHGVCSLICSAPWRSGEEEDLDCGEGATCVMPAEGEALWFDYQQPFQSCTEASVGTACDAEFSVCNQGYCARPLKHCEAI